MDRWTGRNVLVTGASSGIGYAVAESLAKQGMTVIACARNISKIEELAKKVGCGRGKVVAIKCDLTKEEEILQMFKTIEGKFGHVDILINNAGLCNPDDLLTGKTDKWRGMIDLNVMALSICSREALRLMEQDKIHDGHIINVNSISGHEVSARFGIFHFYSGTKHMVTALTKALSYEVRQKGTKIRVTSISPGPVETEFANKMTRDSPAMAEAFKSLLNFPLLTAKDISDAVDYVIGAPAHVNIQELIIMPTQMPP